jgi:hypothetical protein
MLMGSVEPVTCLIQVIVQLQESHRLPSGELLQELSNVQGDDNRGGSGMEVHRYIHVQGGPLASHSGR